MALEELKLAPGLRLLGLDLGEKTIGLALSDTLLSIATPMQKVLAALIPIESVLPPLQHHMSVFDTVCKSTNNRADVKPFTPIGFQSR